MNKENVEKLKKYRALLQCADIRVYEYHPLTDIAYSLDDDLNVRATVEGYMSAVEKNGWVLPENRDAYVTFIRGMSDGEAEFNSVDPTGRKFLKRVKKMKMTDDVTGEQYLLFSQKDVTSLRNLEKKYTEQACIDSLTGLYNRRRGKELVDVYLRDKSPFESCAFFVIDIDYFKGVNDLYGHLFGDKVLKSFAEMLSDYWPDDSVIIRVGGDEFVVLIKNIDNMTLIEKLNNFMNVVREMKFEDNEYTPTCSVGVCYVYENTKNCTYENIFGNADWALYQAKCQGRNRCAFCDNFDRYKEKKVTSTKDYGDIDARYFQNDIIAVAFEVLEKNADLDEAINLLLKIIGIRFQVDRVSIILTNVTENAIRCAYQWRAADIPPVITKPHSFRREDFLTYFNSYDENDTVVLDYDNMDAYSDNAKKLLMAPDAKTTLYTAMYDNGQYIGGMSYAICSQKRFWSKDKRKELATVSKIIATYINRKNDASLKGYGLGRITEYDSITGLISFARFREQVEHVVIGNKDRTYALVYSDFENFTAYNKEYGYECGDKLLKNFAKYIISTVAKVEETYFARVVSDQFVLFMPYEADLTETDEKVKRLNETFIRSYINEDCCVRMRIRTGIYIVTPSCANTAAAIDAANKARAMVKVGDEMNVIISNEP